MHIPLIYILLFAEITLIFLALSIIFGIKLIRNPDNQSATVINTSDDRTINLGSSYIEHLETEILKNRAQTAINTHMEHDPDAEHDPEKIKNEKHSKLLKMRDLFLNVERTAAEHVENDINFWQYIYDGMNNVYEHYKTVLHETEKNTETHVVHKKELTEKVFYIETQGRKVDGEVNRLKDIIYDQENTLSDLIKSLKKAEEENPESENSEFIAALSTQAKNLERQLNDSKTCMEVLEMENNRLQEEMHKLEATNAEKDAAATSDNSAVDMKSMREMLEKQEQKIALLTTTIDSLQIDAEQAEKLKSTLQEFAHSSREMMSCITILEEENERLLASSDGESPVNAEEIQQKIKKLQDEIIKRDVDYAKLQEEFASMEKEYLAMYNAMHSNNG